MKLYQQLTVNNLISMQEKLIKLLPNNELFRPRIFFPKDQSIFQEVSELMDFFNIYKLPLDSMQIAFNIVPPYAKTIIHVDSGIPDYSINIPIKHCENTFVKFYTSTGEQLFQPARLINGKTQYASHYYYASESCTVIDSFDSSNTHIASIKSIHKIVNDNKYFRINLLCRSTNNEIMRSIINSELTY